MKKKNCKLILDCISCTYEQMIEIPECLKSGFINKFKCKNSPEIIQICNKNSSFIFPTILFLFVILAFLVFIHYTLKNYRKYVIKSTNIMQI